MRLLALDLGERRIGVAVSDPGQILARGVGVIRRRSMVQDLDAIASLVRELEVEAIIVGLPRRLNGTIGEEAAKAQDYASRLMEELRLPIVLWDERLTTVRATRALAEGGKRKRRLSVDAAAATVLLQDYLDSLKGGKA